MHRLLWIIGIGLLNVDQVLAADPVEKPGMLFTIKGARIESVTRLEPTIALDLQPGQSAHPRIAQAQSYHWIGSIRILEPGDYRFIARSEGTFKLTVNGQEALSKPLKLPAGTHPIEATLTPTGPRMLCELSWVGPDFTQEPLPHQVLSHQLNQRPKEFAEQRLEEQGRMHFEEMSCIRCHASGSAMAKTIVERTGPTLVGLHDRMVPGWVDAWLEDPQQFRPTTTMPHLFTKDAQGNAERYAVLSYLFSEESNRPPEPSINPQQLLRSINRGQNLYVTTGCAACHGLREETKTEIPEDFDAEPIEPLKRDDWIHGYGRADGPVQLYPLKLVGNQATPSALADYLRDPMKLNPHGRMPNMRLDEDSALDLARYLALDRDLQRPSKMPEAPATTPTDLAQMMKVPLPRLPNALQWRHLGTILAARKGCVNCHEMPGTIQAGNNFPSLEAVTAKPDAGCLSDTPNVAKVPDYQLDAATRSALRQFVKVGLDGAGEAAPTYHARRNLTRLNCLNCHQRNGEGGLTLALSEEMRRLENADNADGFAPPLLTGVGHKLKPKWLNDVLLNGGQARPWMNLRMPQYGPANVAELVTALPQLEATPEESDKALSVTTASISTGRELIGKTGHGCISCHDISGVQTAGTRGPDLATTTQRIRHDWYDRWMLHPQRMVPGTRMPQYFPDGKALLTTILDGDAIAQSDAMWNYMNLGPGLPLPAGLEPPAGVVVTPTNKPTILRTFMPNDAGTKPIAVGYPAGFSIVFDAATCRFAYAWAGNFLNTTPVWTGRGGNPAILLGPTVWRGAKGFPWAISSDVPDFAKQWADPEYGLQLPNDAVFEGKRLVHFNGYRLDPNGVPTFRFTLMTPEGKPSLEVAQSATPLPIATATGFAQNFTVRTLSNNSTWLHLGESQDAPRFYDANNQRIVAKPDVIPETFHRVLLRSPDNRVIVLEATDLPKESRWQMKQRDNRWELMLQLPSKRRGAKVCGQHLEFAAGKRCFVAGIECEISSKTRLYSRAGRVSDGHHNIRHFVFTSQTRERPGS